MRLKIEGVAEVLKSIDKLGEVPNLEEAVGKACALIERSAKEKAPKDTGALRRSITSKIEGSGADIAPRTGLLGEAVDREFTSQSVAVVFHKPEVVGVAEGFDFL